MSVEKSQWYPYYCVQDGYYRLGGAEGIPRKICDYLIDAPLDGYEPPDNNEYSRCRFWKYLYHDCEKPLNQALPTISEKMSVVFNPNQPTEPPTDKGYRLIPQIYIKPSQTEAQTRVYVYMGTSSARDEFKTTISVVATFIYQVLPLRIAGVTSS